MKKINKKQKNFIDRWKGFKKTNINNFSDSLQKEHGHIIQHMTNYINFPIKIY